MDGPQWVKPDFSAERGEFERLADEEHVDLQALLKAAETGHLIKFGLEDPRWRGLGNTDSAQDLTLDEVRAMAEEYGRDVEPILKGVQGDGVLPAPIVVELPNGNSTCMAGNTRLMVCRALGIEPTVWWATMEPMAKTGGKMDLLSIALRIAAAYDFKTKMKINAIVLEELARASGIEDYNVIAELTSDSEMHKAIQGLANAIQAEADRLKEHPKKTAARLFR